MDDEQTSASTSGGTPARILYQLIVDRAVALSLSLTEHPSELMATKVQAERLAEQLRSVTRDSTAPRTQRNHETAEAHNDFSRPTPRGLSALFVGHYSVLIGDLTAERTDDNSPLSTAISTAESPRDLATAAFAEFQQHAGAALTNVPVARRSDLLLILVGDIGSAKDKGWRALASRLERDERVCRKLVWLPPDSRAECADSAESFLERTFLARPWRIGAAFQSADLDPLGRLAEEDGVLREWLPLFEAGEEYTPSGDELCIALTRAMRSRGLNPEEGEE